jgi:hypothetical protein
MASYDVDRFREFVRSEGFHSTYDIDQDTMDKLVSDDIALMEFGDRMIRQIMYAENTIPMKQDALDTHLERRRQNQTKEREMAEVERPSMAAYDMPLDGEEEKEGKT